MRGAGGSSCLRTRLALVAGLIGALPVARADEELQKKLANPVSDLITVPVQLTTTGDVGPERRPQHVLNVQPVYPMRLSSEWSWIHRLIMPLLSNPAFAPDEERKRGVGDIVYEGFLSPTPRGGLIWGVGPIVQAPTASDDRLGSGKWAAGPAVVALQQEGRWSVGALVTQVWSFAGDDDRARISQMQIQPIVNYRLSGEHSIAYAGTILVDWKQHDDDRWTVPLGATWSALTKPAGFVPVNYVIGGGYNVIRPDHAGTWFFRFQASFVLPK